MRDAPPQGQSAPPRKRWPKAPGLLWSGAGLAAVYLVAGKLGLTLAFLHESATPVWPPAGIVLAAFLLLGPRLWPAVVVGAFLVNQLTAGSPLTSLGIAAGNTLEGLIGAWLVQRFAGGRSAFERPADVFRFMALAGLLSTAVSATLGVTSLSLGGFAPWSGYSSIWLTWWLGDAGSDLVVAPLLILWIANPSLRWDRRRALEAAGLLGALVLVGLVIFGGLVASPVQDGPIEYLALPLLLWAAFRFGPREAATATLVLSALAIWGTLRGLGPFARGSANESLLLLQAFLCVVAVTTLAVAAAVLERRRAEAALARTAAIVDSSEDAIIGKTPEGIIVSWNAGAQRLYGYAPEEVLGRPVSILKPPDRPDEIPGILARIRRGESVEPYETVRIGKDGRRLAVSLAVSPIRDGDGRIVGASAIARDITAGKWAERRLATLSAVTRVLTESPTLREAGPRLLAALCEGLEWEAGELWMAEAPGGRLRRQARGRAAVEAARPGAAGPVERPGSGVGLAGRAWESGGPVWGEGHEAVAWPFNGGTGMAGVLTLYGQPSREPPPGLIDLLADVGGLLRQFLERESALEGLKRLQKAVEITGMGVTISDLDGRILYTNPAEAALHGYGTEELIGKHVSIFMPPEWRPASKRPPRIESWRRETVNVRRDGTIFPVQLLSDVVVSPEGLPIAIVTYCEEITERKHAEEARRASEERYRLLFERNLAGVYRATWEGRLLECNEAFARILGYASREEVLGRTAWDLHFGRQDRERCLARLKEEGALRNVELRLRRKDGTGVWVLDNETLLPGSDGEDLVDGTVVDITDRKRAEERIEFDAYHDALTGLPNRASFSHRLQEAVAQARRSGRSLAVIFLDLDRFKEVNDTFGHAVGDRLLQAVSGRLKDCVREDDTVARLGGDEFVLLLPRLRRGPGAARLAAKILARLEEPFVLDGDQLKVTASAGIALFPQDGSDGETLLQNADAAMYRAKQRGRNTYELSSGPRRFGDERDGSPAGGNVREAPLQPLPRSGRRRGSAG